VYATPFGQRYAIGALYRAGVQQPQPSLAVVWQAHDALLRVGLRRGYPTVEMMNDRSTHEQVLAAFDEAIAAARRRTAIVGIVTLTSGQIEFGNVSSRHGAKT
jgi:hypothetical protein